MLIILEIKKTLIPFIIPNKELAIPLFLLNIFIMTITIVILKLILKPTKITFFSCLNLLKTYLISLLKNKESQVTLQLHHKNQWVIKGPIDQLSKKQLDTFFNSSLEKQSTKTALIATARPARPATLVPCKNLKYLKYLK